MHKKRQNNVRESLRVLVMMAKPNILKPMFKGYFGLLSASYQLTTKGVLLLVPTTNRKDCQLNPSPGLLIYVIISSLSKLLVLLIG